MTKNCEFHVLLLIFWNMKFVTGYGWKQISWSNLTLQTIASYNVSSVVLVFSMLSLGRILISNLVVANLLMIMYSLPVMILLYLAATFFTPKVFLHEILFTKSTFTSAIYGYIQFTLMQTISAFFLFLNQNSNKSRGSMISVQHLVCCWVMMLMFCSHVESMGRHSTFKWYTSG